MIDTYKTVREMLYKLTAYIKDDGVIKRAIYAEFGRKVSQREVTQVRRHIERQQERFAREKWSKGGGGEMDKFIMADIVQASTDLRRRIVACHPQIMKALEAKGNMVKWDD